MGHLYHGELLVITRGTLFGSIAIPNYGGLYEDVPRPSSGNWTYEVNLEVTFWLHTVQHPKLEVTNHFPMFFPMVPWNSGWIGLRRSTCRTLPMKWETNWPPSPLERKSGAGPEGPQGPNPCGFLLGSRQSLSDEKWDPNNLHWCLWKF